MNKIITLTIICSALSGCATKQYAQVGGLSDAEKTVMSCHDYEVEMARTKGVQDTIHRQEEFDARSVLSFLGDFGVGNYMASSYAESGVRHRLDDLQTARALKGCPASTKEARLTDGA
jgi:hypothetical protein